MKLTDIYTKFETDKGTAHSYIDFYESIFSENRMETLSILEIGVLFGGSLKMWEHYFENSMIYGVEDFSQKTGEGIGGGRYINKGAIMQDMTNHPRISLMDFNCEDKELIASNLSSLSFDYIIDDASHDPEQQKLNFQNYYPYLKEGGTYICEDVRPDLVPANLKLHVLDLYPTLEVSIHAWNKKWDDRLVVVK